MTAIQTFDIGDEIFLAATFYNLAGDIADPTAVAARVVDPAGTTTVLSPAKQSTGVYQATFAPAVRGTHWFRYEGSGAVATAQELRFLVNEERVPAS